MRTALATVANRRAGRERSASFLSAVPPAQDSDDYLPKLAACAASIVYKSPLPSPDGHPIFIINAAALPDTYEVDYDSLLPYVLARLPGEDDLIHGTEYEIIFFAGGQPESATTEKKQGPGIGWYLQAYHVLSRAMRKRLQKLYIVHPKTFVRVLVSVFSTVVSPKFRRKIVHVSNLSALERYTPIVNLLIPPSVMLYDRRLEDEIDTMANGLVFGTRQPLPRDMDTGHTRLPRMLRETSTFLLADQVVTTEGLFRVPPHSVQTDILKEAYDRGQKFIVWKEQGAVVVQPGVDHSLVDEIATTDAYGVHLAAALVKAWYRELREPIFPESSYAYLRSNFANKTSVDVEDLATLIGPQSATSVLTTTSREILIRHLLPLLAAVAKHEKDNKMNATNLAICFGMALLRGPDQLEDAKMTSVVKTVMESAISQWPQLMTKLGISEVAFSQDLETPSKTRMYEDPLPEHSPNIGSTAQALDQWINITEDETKPKQPEHTFHVPRIVQKLPLLSKPPEATKEAAMPPPVPKRKPTPVTQPEPSVDPPRYSHVFGPEDSTRPVSSGGTIASHPESAPAYTQAAPPTTASIAAQAALKMPKRKAVISEAHEHKPAIPVEQQEIFATGSTIQQAEVHSKHPDVLETIPEPVFRKPSWPASANRLPTKLPSLAKPVLPGTTRSSPASSTSSFLTSPSLPKPRTPSPGLLQRMNTIEALGLNLDKAGSPDEDNRYKLEPGRLSLKKASVDDLRRLYEERLTTVQGLTRVNMMKRSYSSS
ncbi:hypothetical protein AMS68_003609 [Peltaster fructicola]|uniref:CRAL-TRIO domain-containing protein n=1 Tax=Peltaster fructicola TaxID=286661 RepID=A0A6H0XTJ2_9PEZI|nr:hypothetical protein AMS68_003609 [Peltaster fructicola]